MPVRFGAFIFQAISYPDLVDDFLFAERIGLDNAWIADHFFWVPKPVLPLLEAWTSLGALAAATNRIRIGTMVTNVATRNPAVLAKQILTVDQISRGRVDVGLGAGFFQREHESLGVEFPNGRGRVARLREAVEILDRALRGGEISFTGDYYRLDQAPMHPGPSQLPRTPIWVAAQGNNSLRTAARFGDAAICMGEGDDCDACLAFFRDRMHRLDEICVELGRDPLTIRRCYYAGYANEPIFQSPSATEDFIGRCIDASATDFVLPLANPVQPAYDASVRAGSMATREMLERLVEDCLPSFRSVGPPPK